MIRSTPTPSSGFSRSSAHPEQCFLYSDGLRRRITRNDRHVSWRGQNGYFTDGSLDSEVMIHEYTHGVSRRLVPNLWAITVALWARPGGRFFFPEFSPPEGRPLHGVYPPATTLPRVNTGIRTRPYSTRMM